MTNREDIIRALGEMVETMDNWKFHDVTMAEFDIIESIAVEIQQLIYMMEGEE